jgi:hypothetical protein
MTRHLPAASAALLLAALFLPCSAHAGNAWRIDAAGSLFITESAIGTEAVFIPVRPGGTEMEVIAIRDGAGIVRIAFNTCQVCNGSPSAFFAPVKDGLQCQSCGFVFPADQVGAGGDSCTPLAIPGVTKENGVLRVPAEVLAAYRGKFRNVKKGRQP